MDAFTLFADPQRPRERSVVGISVSKTVGTAVTRNLVRRRLAALLHDSLLDRTPERLLIVARPSAAAASFDELRAQLHKALG